MALVNEVVVISDSEDESGRAAARGSDGPHREGAGVSNGDACNDTAGKPLGGKCRLTDRGSVSAHEQLSLDVNKAWNCLAHDGLKSHLGVRVVKSYLRMLSNIDNRVELCVSLLQLHCGQITATVADKIVSEFRQKKHTALVDSVCKTLAAVISDCYLSHTLVIGYWVILDGCDLQDNLQNLTAQLIVKYFQQNVDRELLRKLQLRLEVNVACRLWKHDLPDVRPNRVLVERYIEVMKHLPERMRLTVDLLKIPFEMDNKTEEQPVARAISEDVSDATRAPSDGMEETPGAESEVNDEEMRSDEGEVLSSSEKLHLELMSDADKVISMFPNMDRHEVYAYLEAHRNRGDRVRLVIEELIEWVLPSDSGLQPCGDAERLEQMSILASLKRSEPSGGAEATTGEDDIDAKRIKLSGGPCNSHRPECGPSDAQLDGGGGGGFVSERMDVPVAGGSGYVVPSGTDSLPSPPHPHDDMADRCDTLKAVFPDADPEFLLDLLVNCGDNEDQLKANVERLLETKSYPRLKDRLEKERREQMRMNYMTRNFKPEEILEWYKDPVAVFYDAARPVTTRYKELATKQLMIMFRHLRYGHLRKLLLQHNFHFLPILRYLQSLDWNPTCQGDYYRKQTTPVVQLPAEPDEMFYKEFAFSRVEKEFRAYVAKRKSDRESKLKVARESDLLLVCRCCFDDELLAEDVVECPGGHLFCKECVVRGMKVAIGQGKTGLQCMEGSCLDMFALTTLGSVLSPNMFSNLLRKIQVAEIEEAQIADLETCPHCSFAAIMPNKEDRVFQCQNPECLKETCRLCQEPNHVPLRCDEVEKTSEVTMRTYIENKMSEALMRECPRCKRHFTKESGCNLMTCICGAKMCYVCRQPIENYSHFKPGGCPQVSDTELLHHTDVSAGAVLAKQKFIDRNPGMDGQKLKHDPTESIGQVPRPSRQPHEMLPMGHFLWDPLLRFPVHEAQLPVRLQHAQRIARLLARQIQRPPPLPAHHGMQPPALPVHHVVRPPPLPAGRGMLQPPALPVHHVVRPPPLPAHRGMLQPPALPVHHLVRPPPLQGHLRVAGENNTEDADRTLQIRDLGHEIALRFAQVQAGVARREAEVRNPRRPVQRGDVGVSPRGTVNREA